MWVLPFKIYDYLIYAKDIFWHPYFWLPSRMKWKDVEPTDEFKFTDYRDFYTYLLPLTAVVLLVRYCLEKTLFTRLALALKIKDIKLRNAPKNPLLENAYLSNPRWSHKAIIALAKQTDWSERRVQSWLRLRKSQDKPTTLVKFREHCWRSFFYTNIFFYGVYALWDKPWFWNIHYCWVKWPYHEIDDDIWLYYMLSCAFYTSLAISQFFDVKRKDFWQMFVHHLVTISLIMFSWICNLTRVGSLVLVSHDASDFIVDAAKSAKYAKSDRLATWLFIIFVVVWTLTRLVYFPFWIIYSIVFESYNIANQMFPGFYLFSVLLLLLMMIHLYYTALIYRLTYTTWALGKVDDDIRSSNDEAGPGEMGKPTDESGSSCSSTRRIHVSNHGKS